MSNAYLHPDIISSSFSILNFINSLFFVAQLLFRLFSPIFLHNNFFHLFLNSISLIFLGHHLESSFQSIKTLFLYLLAGIFGNIASSIWLSSSVSVGASGGIMGLGGLWTFFILMNMGRMGEAEKRVALIIGVYFLGNLMMGGGGEEQKVDYAAHAGNFSF